VIILLPFDKYATSINQSGVLFVLYYQLKTTATKNREAIKMTEPKSKTSKQRKHKRAANWKAAMPGLTPCPQCHELKLNHRVCKACGYYDGKVIKEVKKEA